MQKIVRIVLCFVFIISFTTKSGTAAVLPDYNLIMCPGALLAIPHPGSMGWPYMDPGQDVIETDGTIHRGIDIFGNPGDPVYAAYDGVVLPDLGHLRVRHSGISSGSLPIDTYYGHVIASVQAGATVLQGHKIGVLDNSGNKHVHFDVLQQVPNELIFANSLDPSPYLNAQVNYFDGARRDNTRGDILGDYKRPVLERCNDTSVGGITGIVKDPDGKPVSDALVEIEGTGQARRTDFGIPERIEGQFSFSNAPVGQFTLTASKPGVGRVSVPVTILPSAVNRIPDLLLVPFCPATVAMHTKEKIVPQSCVPQGAGVDVAFVIDTTSSITTRSSS
jgi:hypothetical protein